MGGKRLRGLYYRYAPGGLIDLQLQCLHLACSITSINVQLSENPAARYTLNTAVIAFCQSKWWETRKLAVNLQVVGRVE